MALTEGQVQLRDLVMGPGTLYRFVTHFNPFVRNVRADQGGPRAWNDGAWSGAEWTEQVAIPMRLVILATGTAHYVALQQALSAAFAPSHDDLPLTFMVGGTEYVMFGRPRMVEPDARMIDGTTYVQAAFVALNPAVMSSVQHTSVLSLPLVSGGVTRPLTRPYTIAATVISGRALLTNAGKKTTGLILRVDGPVTTPRVSVLAGGVTTTLTVNLTLLADQWLDIDTAARTVYLNGTASRRGDASSSREEWPLLPPGTHELAFDASIYNALAQLTASWRDAWY